MSNCVVVSPRDSMTLGELIAIARECKNFSLRDLERATGISSALLSQIETGKIKNPSFAKVVRITRALGISLDRAASTVR
jgi:transcriptional regulator with XRE-family HTH domain